MYRKSVFGRIPLGTVLLLLSALLSLGQGMKAQSAASQYSVTQIKGPNGGGFNAGAINNSGNVVGYSAGVAHVLFWSQGNTNDLGTMGGSEAIASGINDAGQIAGTVRTSDGIDHFIYTNGSVLNIGAPTDIFYGYGINSRGDVANGQGGAPFTTPFLYTYSTANLQFLAIPGCSNAAGIDVNDSEVVMGSAIGGSCGHQSVVVWSGGNFQILPTVTGASASQATKINAGGQIAGWSISPNHPLVWQEGNSGAWTFTDLGVPTGVDGAESFGINDLGVVVGELDSSIYGTHGFVWDPTNGIQDLNSLIPPGSGFVLGTAVAVNNSGQILGQLSDGTAYLLTPISPITELQNLISSTLLTNLAANVQNQLDAKLSAALASLDAAKKNSATTAANQLQAFVNAVNADVQSGKLTCAQATPLVSAAQNVVTALQQPPLSSSLSCQ